MIKDILHERIDVVGFGSHRSPGNWRIVVRANLLDQRCNLRRLELFSMLEVSYARDRVLPVATQRGEPIGVKDVQHSYFLHTVT